MNPTSLSEKYNNILKLYNQNMMNEICLVKVKDILQIKLCEVQQWYVILPELEYAKSWKPGK